MSGFLAFNFTVQSSTFRFACVKNSKLKLELRTRPIMARILLAPFRLSKIGGEATIAVHFQG